MIANIGTPERLIRIIVGAALCVYFFGFTSGAARWVGVAGLVLIGTALIRFCPLWAMFGVNTAKRTPGG